MEVGDIKSIRVTQSSQHEGFIMAIGHDCKGPKAAGGLGWSRVNATAVPQVKRFILEMRSNALSMSNCWVRKL